MTAVISLSNRHHLIMVCLYAVAGLMGVGGGEGGVGIGLPCSVGAYFTPISKNFSHNLFSCWTLNASLGIPLCCNSDFNWPQPPNLVITANVSCYMYGRYHWLFITCLHHGSENGWSMKALPLYLHAQEVPYTCIYYGNFCQEKIFANFTNACCWQKFLPWIFLHSENFDTFARPWAHVHMHIATHELYP